MSGTNSAADGSQSATQSAGLTAADVERARAEGRTEGHKQGLAEGRAQGATDERTRIQAVESALMPGHEALIQEMKFDGKTTGGEAALAVLKAEREMRSTRAGELASDAPAALALRPSSTVRQEERKGQLSRAEIDQKAKAHVATHPGTTYVQAVKIIEQQGA